MIVVTVFHLVVNHTEFRLAHDQGKTVAICCHAYPGLERV